MASKLKLKVAVSYAAMQASLRCKEEEMDIDSSPSVPDVEPEIKIESAADQKSVMKDEADEETGFTASEDAWPPNVKSRYWCDFYEGCFRTYGKGLTSRNLYVTGPLDSSAGVFIVWDACTFVDAPLRLADMLGAAGYLVLTSKEPIIDRDFDVHWFPKNDSQKRSLRIANEAVESYEAFIPKAMQDYPRVKRWGLTVHLGAKMRAFTDEAGLSWTVGEAAAPQCISPETAAEVRVPLMEHENSNIYLWAFAHTKSSDQRERLRTSHERGVIANSDFHDDLKEYKRSYHIAAEFFAENLDKRSVSQVQRDMDKYEERERAGIEYLTKTGAPQSRF